MLDILGSRSLWQAEQTALWGKHKVNGNVLRLDPGSGYPV